MPRFGGVGANFTAADADPTSFDVRSVLGVLLGSIAVLVVVTLVMKRFGLRQPQEPATTAELIASGESYLVEFKQTARWNIHSGKKDPKIELVIAKTVAGFLNRRRRDAAHRD